MKKYFMLVLIPVAVAGAFAAVVVRNNAVNGKTSNPVVCTADAKICPDGSGVGRIGPRCEFAPCPSSPTQPVATSTQTKGFITGRVTVSFACPVASAPSMPGCNPTPYQGTVTLQSHASGALQQVMTDANGTFHFSVAPGLYTVLVKSASKFFHCSSQEVVVSAGITRTIDMACDSGIRQPSLQ